MHVKRASLMLSIAAVSAALAMAAAACASSPVPTPQPTVDKAAMEKKAMEDQAMAEKLAMEKKAMEDKAMAEKSAMEKKAMEDKAMAEKSAMEKKAMEDKAMAEKSMMAKLPDQQFAAHFVDSAPAHGAVLSQVPGQITIRFDFTLNDASSITVTKDGKQVSSGRTALSSNGLAMTAEVPVNAGAGTYLVDYVAYWPDRSYHSGKFAFTVSP